MLVLNESKDDVEAEREKKRWNPQRALLTNVEGDVEKLEMFRSEIAVHVLSELVEFDQAEVDTGEKALEGSILWFSRLVHG